MPSFIMHIAIANKYIKNHKDEIKDYDEFINGTIYPDLTDDKNITHYGKWGHYINNIIFEDFIKDEKIDFSKDFYKGYLLHLLADDFTYNHILKEEFDRVKRDNAHYIIYDEFYSLNKSLIEKYEINVIPEEVKNFAVTKPCELRYLSFEKVVDMIDKISSVSLEEEIENIRKNGKPKYNFKEV